MTEQDLQKEIQRSGLSLDENQTNRLRTLFRIFESSDLHWGRFQIKIENNMPILEISFTIS